MSYYEFVPVSSVHRMVFSYDGRERFENVYLVEPEFEAISHVHVSSGSKKLITNGRIEILMLHYRNSRNIPVIPGSSFKGAVSTNFLGLCGDAEVVSNLFGATRRRAVISKTFFSDLVPDREEVVRREVNRQWEPRRKRRGHIKFYTGKASKTARYGLLECLPPGTRFRSRVYGYNLKGFELGGLLMSMGFGVENAVFKIGYAKPQGFGQIKPVNVRVCRIYYDDDFSIVKEESDVEEFIAEFRDRYRERIEKYAKIIFAGV